MFVACFVTSRINSQSDIAWGSTMKRSAELLCVVLLVTVGTTFCADGKRRGLGPLTGFLLRGFPLEFFSGRFTMLRKLVDTFSHESDVASLKTPF